MADPDAAFAAFASARGLEPVSALAAGPLTPLLVEAGAGQLSPAARGRLAEAGDGSAAIEGVVGHLAYTRNKTFRFTVALTEVPGASEFVPRLFCVCKGRRTRDDEFYGFEARYSKLWTESTKLNEHYVISTSPFQDPVFLRELFSPAFVDYLATEPPTDFSFELAYGYLVGSVEEDYPDAAGLEALCLATARVAERVRRECEEEAG
jgi:hypothetical protein